MNASDAIKEIQTTLGLDQQELAKALGVSPATVHRMLRQADKEIDLEIHTLIDCVAEVLNNAKASGLTLEDIKNAAIKTGFAGIVARGATAGIISQARLGLLASATRFSWIGALGGVVGAITGAAALSFFQKIQAQPDEASIGPPKRPVAKKTSKKRNS